MTTGPSTNTRTGSQAFLLPGGPVGLLIIHGLGGSVTEYRAAAELLNRNGYTVSGMMVAGHGLDMAALAATRPEDWATSVETAYHELAARCRQVFILGASYGAMLGVQAATRHPELAGLICVNPAVSFRVGGSWQDVALKGLRLFSPYIQKPGLSPADRQRASQLGSLPGWPIDTLLSSKAYLRDTLLPSLDTLSMPTLVLVSRDDRYVDPVATKKVFTGRPLTEVVTIPSSSHRPFRQTETVSWLVTKIQTFVTNLEK